MTPTEDRLHELAATLTEAINCELSDVRAALAGLRNRQPSQTLTTFVL